jgi:hypothetical protein
VPERQSIVYARRFLDVISNIIGNDCRYRRRKFNHSPGDLEYAWKPILITTKGLMDWSRGDESPATGFLYLLLFGSKISGGYEESSRAYSFGAPRAVNVQAVACLDI